MGFQQGFPETGLKLQNKLGILYQDNDLFAGVDYIDHNDESDYDNDEDIRIEEYNVDDN